MAALIDELRERGLLEYGAVFGSDIVRRVLGIDTIDEETPILTLREARRLLNDQKMAEMNAIDAVRDQLLNEGKYLKGEGDMYRVLTAGENEMQVRRYQAAADRKLRRGMRLLNNTPPDAKTDTNLATRLFMKLGSSTRPRAS